MGLLQSENDSNSGDSDDYDDDFDKGDGGNEKIMITEVWNRSCIKCLFRR